MLRVAGKVRRHMSRVRSPLEVAAGQVISAIQREWNEESGKPTAGKSETVMHASHALLQAAKNGSLTPVVGTGTVAAFLGEQWVRAHPRVWPHIQLLEALALRERDA
jgi:hypothetical protein